MEVINFWHHNKANPACKAYPGSILLIGKLKFFKFLFKRNIVVNVLTLVSLNPHSAENLKWTITPSILQPIINFGDNNMRICNSVANSIEPCRLALFYTSGKYHIAFDASMTRVKIVFERLCVCYCWRSCHALTIIYVLFYIYRLIYLLFIDILYLKDKSKLLETCQKRKFKALKLWPDWLN